MKTVLTKFLAFSSVALLLLASCKKNDLKVTAKDGTPGTLTASANSIVLSSANSGDNAVSFNYTPTDYGFKAAVSYTLQIDAKGNNFANSKNIGLTSSSKTYTGADLNTLLLSMGFIAGSPAQLEARIKSELATNVQTTYSNTVTVTVTPYFDIPFYSSLYVPGAYQGWSPGTAKRISSPSDNKLYEGFVYFADAGSLEFKYTSDPDWNHTNYGDAGGGSLSTDGGAGNLKVPSTGYYLLKADLTANTWSATKTQWGIIGDATPGGWDSSTALTFDATNEVWTATVHLIGGKQCKFRANDAWDINLGDNNPANGVLAYNGANINVDVTGDYKVTLNLSNPAFYYYSLIKQ
ncbi:MAG TPA: SusE domain-containing protein [Mucilaginibacter sp.]|nr:SusE domain-containing protein [Mucilaginibacter sp.]